MEVSAAKRSTEQMMRYQKQFFLSSISYLLKPQTTQSMKVCSRLSVPFPHPPFLHCSETKDSGNEVRSSNVLCSFAFHGSLNLKGTQWHCASPTSGEDALQNSTTDHLGACYWLKTAPNTHKQSLGDHRFCSKTLQQTSAIPRQVSSPLDRTPAIVTMKPTWECCNCYSQIQSMTKSTCGSCKHTRCKFCRMLSRKSPAQLHETHLKHSVFAENEENKKTGAEMKRHVVVLDTKEGPKKSDANMKRHLEVTTSKKTAKAVIDGEERHC